MCAIDVQETVTEVKNIKYTKTLFVYVRRVFQFTFGAKLFIHAGSVGYLHPP